jgi:hypothetical protein
MELAKLREAVATKLVGEFVKRAEQRRSEDAK